MTRYTQREHPHDPLDIILPLEDEPRTVGVAKPPGV
jgi:hypothetical protein